LASILYGIIHIMSGSKLQVQEELLLAKQSRIEGNEGRARVCARRAAGAAAQEYLQHADMRDRAENALESLLIIKEELDLPESVEVAINYLLQRVDEEHNLPQGIDLIREAEKVIRYLETGVRKNQSVDA
jgi:hypothetical protein